MPITFECKHCARRVKVSRRHAGQRGRCPGCGEAVLIPSLAGPDPRVLAIEELGSGELPSFAALSERSSTEQDFVVQAEEEDTAPAAPLTREAQVRLVLQEGKGAERLVELSPLPFTCGRKQGAQLVLHDSDVSYSHCMIVESAGKLFLVDLDSTNGTFLNGRRLEGRALLEAGAEIRLGRQVRLRVERSGEAEDAQPKRVNVRSRRWGRQLRRQLACPNCWHRTAPERLFFIAKHPELLGDPVLGDDEYRRFQPTRFNLRGEALDPLGTPSARVACPRCHLSIADALLEAEPLFISLIGAPASGKSYFLTTMSWELRRLLPRARLSFSDADPSASSAIYDYEQTLFAAGDPDQLTEIRKTQADDPQLYRDVLLDGAPQRFPVPIQFSLWPTPDHPAFGDAASVGRVVVLYDNAGEDYLPGAGAESSVTDHLERFHILLFLYDPTQDREFRAACQAKGIALAALPEEGRGGSGLRQETVLREAIVKIRRRRQLAANERLQRPLLVIAPKFDAWKRLANFEIEEEPYAGGAGDLPLSVRLRTIERTSDKLRALFLRFCPEFVASAEGLAEVVRYLPVSSLGRAPELVERGDTSFFGIRPRDVAPKWVTVPLVYALCKWAPGLLAAEGAGGGTA